MASIVESLIRGEQQRLASEAQALDAATRVTQMEEMLRTRAIRKQRTSPDYAVAMDRFMDPQTSVQDLGKWAAKLAPEDLEYVNTNRQMRLRMKEQAEERMFSVDQANSLVRVLDPNAGQLPQDVGPLSGGVVSSLLSQVGGMQKTENIIAGANQRNQDAISAAESRLDKRIQSVETMQNQRIASQEKRSWQAQETAVQKALEDQLSMRVFGKTLTDLRAHYVDKGGKKLKGQQYLPPEYEGLTKQDMERTIVDAVGNAAELYHNGVGIGHIVDQLAHDIDYQKAQPRSWRDWNGEKASATVRPGQGAGATQAPVNQAEQSARAAIREAFKTGGDLDGDALAAQTGLTPGQLQMIFDDEKKAFEAGQ